jgi:hypothetical protein
MNNNHKILNLVRLVAIKIFPETAQDTGSTRFTPQDFMKKPKDGTSGEI